MQGKSYVALDGPEQENHVIIIFQNKTKGNLLVGKGGGEESKTSDAIEGRKGFRKYESGLYKRT